MSSYMNPLIKREQVLSIKLHTEPSTKIEFVLESRFSYVSRICLKSNLKLWRKKPRNTGYIISQVNDLFVRQCLEFTYIVFVFFGSGIDILAFFGLTTQTFTCNVLHVTKSTVSYVSGISKITAFDQVAVREKIYKGLNDYHVDRYHLLSCFCGPVIMLRSTTHANANVWASAGSLKTRRFSSLLANRHGDRVYVITSFISQMFNQRRKSFVLRLQ